MNVSINNRLFKLKVLILAMMFLICGVPACTNPEVGVAETNIKDCVPSISNISRETAKLIAKGILFLDYDLKRYDAVVSDSIYEKEEAWKVHFLRRIGERVGSGPIVFVSKKTGVRLHLVHSK